MISLILFRCAKRFILPQKTKTSEKRVRSFQSQNSTAQSHKMQYLSQFFFLYRSSLTIQHKILFQRLSAFDNKLVIYVGKRGGLPRRLCFLIRELFRHKKIVRDTDRKNKTPYINVSFLEFDFLESYIFLENPPFSPTVDLE